MSAHVIDGNRFAEGLRAEVEEELRELTAAGVQPGLATLLVGEDYAAAAYERRVRRLAEEIGCRYTSELLSLDVEEAEALAVVGKLNADPRVSGILILRPLPPQVSEADVYRTLDPLKDVEAVHPENAGLLALGEPRFTPSTPASVFYMLDRYVAESGRDPATFYNGLDLVLVGRSNNVGKPALWLGPRPRGHGGLRPPLHVGGGASRGAHDARRHPRRRRGRPRARSAGTWSRRA